ncbi:olfactory receptor 6F1-like [Ambystoma mexicanum]|uniref:olfactory receptor 6F1-like n=1 Tax=Ambystoma mexicanum TaxID=8296 RepID=UPI0037E8E6BE
MEEVNQTLVTEFILLGFSQSATLNWFILTAFLAAYLFTIAANIVIVVLVKENRSLHTPMYFFLCNFSLLEIGYTSVIIPRALADLSSRTRNISVVGCLTQFYFIFFCGSVEYALLTVMAWDRYLAICSPLRYSAVMSPKLCIVLAAMSWLSGCLIPMMPAVWVSDLIFCGPNQIDHFFCDFAPLLKLSCTETSKAEKTFLGQACVLILTCFLLTMVSYTYIISTVLRIPSATGRQKAFSTCAAHLTVVSVFYGTTIFMYVRPSAGDAFPLDKAVSVFYSVITPMANPLIYSLRNESIKRALLTLIKRRMKF